jgi:hypothetical protein
MLIQQQQQQQRQQQQKKKKGYNVLNNKEQKIETKIK